MKNKLKFVNVFIMLATFCLLICSCEKNAEKDNASLWDNAVYTENTELGEGNKTITVEVKAEDKSVSFKIKTDKTTLGDALTEHNLIQGENGAYGMYVKVVNGITADYDKDQSYWGFSKNGESMQTGVDGAEIADGEHYEVIYTKN